MIETTTAGEVACMIAEPIQGVGGFVVPPDGFFGAMKEVLDEYGTLPEVRRLVDFIRASERGVVSRDRE